MITKARLTCLWDEMIYKASALLSFLAVILRSVCYEPPNLDDPGTPFGNLTANDNEEHGKIANMLVILMQWKRQSNRRLINILRYSESSTNESLEDGVCWKASQGHLLQIVCLAFHEMNRISLWSNKVNTKKRFDHTFQRSKENLANQIKRDAWSIDKFDRFGLCVVRSSCLLKPLFLLACAENWTT